MKNHAIPLKKYFEIVFQDGDSTMSMVVGFNDYLEYRKKPKEIAELFERLIGDMEEMNKKYQVTHL